MQQSITRGSEQANQNLQSLASQRRPVRFVIMATSFQSLCLLVLGVRLLVVEALRCAIVESDPISLASGLVAKFDGCFGLCSGGSSRLGFGNCHGGGSSSHLGFGNCLGGWSSSRLGFGRSSSRLGFSHLPRGLEQQPARLWL